MTLLRDYPVIRTQGAEIERECGFFDAVWSAPGNVTDAARQLANDTGAGAVLVVSAHVEPSMQAAVIRIEPEMTQTDLVVGFPSKSHVTGLYLRAGAVLVPSKSLEKATSVPEPSLILPHAVGDFLGNETPELAFENGYATTFGGVAKTPIDRQRLALAASLGTDALNGYWWILGALSGLSPEAAPVHAAWKRHEPLLSTPNDLPRHLQGEARRIRLACDLPVGALSQGQSRALKAMLPEWPPDDIWATFIASCAAIGPEFSELAARYRRAVGHIWAELA